jgi:hypothetical protein
MGTRALDVRRGMFGLEKLVDMLRGAASDECPRMCCHTGDARVAVEIRRLEALVRRAQRAWRHAVTDPAHLVCRRRLAFEFAELNEIRVVACV